MAEIDSQLIFGPMMCRIVLPAAGPIIAAGEERLPEAAELVA